MSERVRSLSAVDRYWCVPAPAARLAWLRFLVGAFSVIYVAARVQVLTSFSHFGLQQFQPVGVVRWLPAPLPSGWVWGVWLATLLCGLLFVAGAYFRVSGPAFALLLLWVLCYRNSWGMIFHLENLMLLHVMILGGSRAADALSVDALAGRAKAHADRGRYGWPIRLMCAVTVASYLLAGIAKLRVSGWDWADGMTLRNHIAYDALRKQQLGSIYSPLGVVLVPHAWLFPPLAWFTMLVELGAPLALLHRKLGYLWVAAMWLFHVGIAALMAITFVYPLLGVGFACFFPVERLGSVFRRAVFRRAAFRRAAFRSSAAADPDR